MENDEIRRRLLPHQKRPIRAFLKNPDDSDASAFWELVYSRTPAVTHDVALVVADELERSARTVGELLAGWRPSVLKAVHELAALRGQSDPWENRGGAPS